MALYGASFTLNYVAWDTVHNVGKTGDAANHVLRWIKDGVALQPTNAPVEVDEASAPGVYKLTITAAEAEATYGTLAGKSSTPGVSIMPVSVAFERLPDAAPGSPGGLPVLDASGAVQTNVAAVWDEPRSQHTIAGTFGAVGEWLSVIAGTGARTIVMTVNDGANPLESATVRATKGAETYTAKTNATGQATFYLDDGTWTFVATLAGYAGASEAHVVDAAQSPLTISLSQLAIAPSPPGTVTGYAVVLDEYGTPEPGVTCSAQLVYTPSGSGVVGDTAVQTSTSDANGVVRFAGLLPGGIYVFTRGSNSATVAVPRNAADLWQISNFGGSP